MYFASVRHDGVLYFGTPITAPVDLDSLYLINAYDTLVAPPGGVSIALEARSLFFEPAGSEWAVTDVFQLRNDGDQTLVPRLGGRVWGYPLPDGARDVSAQQEMSEEVISAEGGDIVFRAALPPGPRLFVLRYFVDSLSVAIPTPGETEMLDVLVREPAPSIAIEGLVQEQSIQLEVGSTYRRFAGQEVTLPQIQISPVQGSASASGGVDRRRACARAARRRAPGLPRSTASGRPGPWPAGETGHPVADRPPGRGVRG